MIEATTSLVIGVVYNATGTNGSLLPGRTGLEPGDVATKPLIPQALAARTLCVQCVSHPQPELRAR
jgi:hypothetical protein